MAIRPFLATSFVGGISSLDLASTCFAITPADPSLTSPNVFDWNTTAVNDIRATAFYVTEDPSSSDPLTELVLPLGETKTIYIVGPLYSSDTVFGNIGGVKIEVTNNDGVLGFVRLEQLFTPAVGSWPETTYDELTQSNGNIGEFRQVSADYIFTPVPVDLSQVASDVKQMRGQYQGLIQSGSYDFTLFPAPTTGNAYIDSSPTDILAGTRFIAAGDITITTHPAANPPTVYEIKDGDTVTVVEDSSNWPNAVLNINAASPDELAPVALRLEDGDLTDFTTSGSNTLVTDLSATLVSNDIRIVSAKTWSIGTQREATVKLEAFEDERFTLTLGASYLGVNGRVVAVSANHIDDNIENSAAHKPSVYVTSPGTLTINRDDTAQAGVSTIAIRITIEDAVDESVVVPPNETIFVPETSFTPSINATTTAPTEPDSFIANASFSYVGEAGGRGNLKMHQAWLVNSATGATAGAGDYLWELPVGYAIAPDFIDASDTLGRGMRSWGVATLVADSDAGSNDNHIVGEIILAAGGVKIFVDDDGNATEREFVSSTFYSLNDALQQYKFECEIPVIRTP